MGILGHVAFTYIGAHETSLRRAWVHRRMASHGVAWRRVASRGVAWRGGADAVPP